MMKLMIRRVNLKKMFLLRGDLCVLNIYLKYHLFIGLTEATKKIVAHFLAPSPSFPKQNVNYLLTKKIILETFISPNY